MPSHVPRGGRSAQVGTTFMDPFHQILRGFSLGPIPEVPTPLAGIESSPCFNELTKNMFCP